MKVSKKHIATGMLALGLVTTAGAGVTAASTGTGIQGFHQRGGQLEVMADLVGISEEEFKTRVENGERPQDILEASGVTPDDMRAAHELRQQERLATEVANGNITQEEADARLAKQAEHKAHMDASRTALENNDFDAFSAAVAGTPMETKVDAKTFAKMVEAHNLREAGDHEGARAIMDAIGIHPDGPMGDHGPRGEHRPDDAPENN